MVVWPCNAFYLPLIFGGFSSVAGRDRRHDCSFLDHFLTNLYVLLRKGKPMARAKRGNQLPDVEFVTLRLSNAAKEDFEHWRTEAKDRWPGELHHLCEAGYRFGIRWDEYNSCALCSCTCWETDSPNHGLCFTTRAEDAYTALLLSLFKLLEVYAGAEWREREANSAWG